MAMKTGAEVYKNKQESKQLQSLAERNYSERMAKGEVDFKVKTLDAQSGSIKDEIVLCFGYITYACYFLFCILWFSRCYKRKL